MRPGWRVLKSLEATVNALAFGYMNQQRVLLAHGGTKLYRWDGETLTVLHSGVKSARSTIFFAHRGSDPMAFFLTGDDYLCYDGKAVKPVTEIATIPRVLIGGTPAGGGTLLQPVNLLQPKRIEEKAGDGTTTLYQLGTTELDSTPITVKVISSSGDVLLTEGTDFTADRKLGQITFKTAPEKPAVKGEDNVIFTYSKTVSDYAERVKGCTVSTLYGLGGSNRVFMTRNPQHRARDYWSEINDPTYFPDLNYSVVGSDNTAMMGYAKLGEYLLLIKENNQQDTNIFIRTATMSDGEAVFTIKPGITGYGAIAPRSFASLVDEPLLLSHTGVYAITSNVITARDTLQNRSAFVDTRLVGEPNLEQAEATEWNGYYLLAVNGHCYLLDSRQRSQSRDSAFVYEAYYWENMPVHCWMVMDGDLYFGTTDGRICKLNSDISGMNRFNDDGQPIDFCWSTCADDDGQPSRYKTMLKKGCGVTPKPYTRSSFQIYIQTESMPEPQKISDAYVDIFDWEDIDFARFTFNSADGAAFIPFKKKVKDYKTMRIWLRGSAKNEGFGIFNIVKKYTVNNEIKR